MGSLTGRVALVTGASRGAGRGIARVLGERGATVYVTGRTVRGGESPTGDPHSIDGTVGEVTERGGVGVAVPCDHTDLAQIDALFERLAAERGRLDILVSNAWGGYERRVWQKPFWELDPGHLDRMLDAGLRSHLLTVQRAATLLRETPGALVAITTSVVGEPYHGNLYYDVVKTAINRMPVGLAQDLRTFDVAALAVSPGWMHTERMNLTPDEAAQTESTEFVGRAVAALAEDPDVLRHTGRVMTVVELAEEYGFTDINGRVRSPYWENRLSP